MYTNRRSVARISVIAIAAAFTLLISQTSAQNVNATLRGTVLDASGAVIPGAAVSLKNEASNDIRRTISNQDGYFTFVAVPPASYTIAIEKDGFTSWQAKSIVLNSGDQRNVLGIQLKPGATKEVVTVEASSTSITPVDSGEKSTIITEKVLQNVAIQGQDAQEFIKIMPGMAYTGGVVNQASFASGGGTDEATGGNHPVGSFSANGSRTGALDITSDGAHILDPGCNCGEAMNTNAEMTQEVKMLTSNFGADNAKGPVVISAIGKSGGQQFHGEAYFYARHYDFNANDWLNIHAGKNAAGQEVAPRAQTQYYYPGVQFGGPVLFPGTSFNHDRNKLFFFFATQYYKQDVDNGIYHAVVPSEAMRNGDFSDSGYLSTLNGYAVTGTPSGADWTGGKINPSAIDLNGQRLMNTYPLPNVDPGTNQGFNYISAGTRYSNMFQIRGKVDYNFSDSLKLYVSYNRQKDSRQESLDTLWTGNGQSWASPTTPYPTPIVESTISHVVSANLVKVFSPTLTNELVFSYTFLNLPNHFADPSKVSRQGLGLDYGLLFDHPNPEKLIMPQMTGWGDGISNVLNSGFELNGVVYAKKTLPSVSDNISKVWGTHTTKFGFYWERVWNSQPGNSAVNGTAVFANWGAGSSGNAYADMLIGQTTNYSEQNFNTVPAFRYLSEEFYGQDSWKLTRRLTLEYGLRVSHLGPWVDTTGYGFAAWYPNLLASNTGGTANGVLFPGVEWHKVNSATPLSGSGSTMFFYNPRAGFAYDIFGNGRTILRGGYGMYRFHDEQNVQNGAYGLTQGSFSNAPLSGSDALLRNLKPFTGTFSTPSGVTVLDPHDSAQPRTQNYSLTVAQRTPWNSVLEVAYVGSKSDYLSNYNNNFDQINLITSQALFAQGWLPNCYPAGQPNDGGACAASGANTGYDTSQTQSGRPLSTYGTVKIIDHKMYSNYNSLQVTWNKQSGHFTFMTNYTYSKALGIRGENGAALGDPTVLRNNYGTLPNNRTNIFNIAYVYEFPKLHNGNAFVKGAANGWQVSGIAQYQTGADLQASVSSNFNYSAFIPAGTTFMGETITTAIQASNQNVLGTPDITLMPRVTCNPRSGLQSKQFINGKCFDGFATPGQQGSYIFPTLTGPGFFNTDLSLFKNFTWGASESKKLQFRFSGYNFLNHPIRSFIANDPGLNLSYDSGGNLMQHGGTTFGFANNKTGHRIMQGEVKFSF